MDAVAGEEGTRRRSRDRRPECRRCRRICFRPRTSIRIRSCGRTSAISAATLPASSPISGPRTALAITRRLPLPGAIARADYPREKIVSPYPYKTAKEHYEALMAAAKAKGGPTVYTKATTPDWDGYYARDQQADHGAEWIWGTVNQVPTILSLLTPEYQKRMVQMNYHEAVDNAPQWEASFCYPEGFMRWWAQASQGGNFQLTMTPWNVQFLSGIAANFLRQVLIGKEHVQKVPQWYGETVGFWDGTTLITWTANVQAWTLSHSMFEFSDKIETVEICKPVIDASGKFIGTRSRDGFLRSRSVRAAAARHISLCPAARRRKIRPGDTLTSSV